MRKFIRVAAVGAATVVIAAGALAAQATDSTRGLRGQRGMREAKGSNTTRLARRNAIREHGPDAMLFRGIELTPQQKSAIESARVKSILDQKPLQSELVAARTDLEVARIRRDSTAAKAATERMTKLRERFASARDTREKEMRDVLTPAQRSQLDRNIGYAQSRREMSGRFAGRVGLEGRRGALRERGRGFDDRDRARGMRGQLDRNWNGRRGMMRGDRDDAWERLEGRRGFGPMWRDRGELRDGPPRGMLRDRSDGRDRFRGQTPRNDDIREPSDSARS